MSDAKYDQIRADVRAQYGKVARTEGSCCSPGCCGPNPRSSLKLGYDESDLAAAPEGANMGLGCGNPQAIAALKPGETVLDLGSGGGFDAFLAAAKVGPSGRVIGVDMTPDMVAKARDNARRAAMTNVEFRLGEIEHLPVADSSVDVIISNCVINLSPDKEQVFRDAFRALRPGGRLALSDVVATTELPESLAQDLSALTGCIAGAASVDTIREMLAAAGFTDLRIEVKEDSRAFIRDWFPGSHAEDYVASANIEAIRPR